MRAKLITVTVLCVCVSRICALRQNDKDSLIRSKKNNVLVVVVIAARTNVDGKSREMKTCTKVYAMLGG